MSEMDGVALLFPGQGSQAVGMGRDLYERFPAAREVFEQADRLLGFSLSQLCFEGPADRLNDTLYTQPAVFTVSVAALRAMEPQLEDVACVAGHSLGEFAALVAADALPFDDGLALVQERARLMKEAGDQSPGGMVAVLGLDVEEMETLCTRVQEETGEYVGVANDNCPGQVVVSGAEAAISALAEAAKAAGARRVIRLAVSIAPHSPLMARAAEAFRRALAKAPFRPPRVPFIANATARPVTDPDQIREVLGRQLTSPVYWTDSIRWMVDQGVRRFIEVGPGSVLTGLLRRIDRTVERMTTPQVLGVEG